MKSLGFPWIPLVESGLFNGLQRIQTKLAPANPLPVKPGVAPRPGFTRRFSRPWTRRFDSDIKLQDTIVCCLGQENVRPKL
jgi:hypothetical protein